MSDDGDILRTWKERAELAATSFFQTAEWARLLARHFPLYSLAPVATDRFFIPLIRNRRWGWLSDSLYGMPMMTRGGIFFANPPTDSDWIEVGRQLGRLTIGTTVITLPVGVDPPPEPLSGFEIEEASTHLLSLEGGHERVREGMTRHCGKSIRRALKEGVIVDRDESDSAIADHWALVSAMFEKWKPDPPLSFEFIRDLARAEGGRLYVARKEGRAVVSLLAFCGGKEVFLWQAARAETDFPVGADNLLRARIIEDACGEGYETVDFGGSLGDPGIERFKATFGAKPVSYKVLKRTHPLVRFLKGARAR